MSELSPRWLAGVLLACAALLAVLVLVPYSSGYEAENISILQQLFGWNGREFGGYYFREEGKWQHGLLAVPLVVALGWFTRRRWQEPLGERSVYPAAQRSWLGLGVLIVGLLLWYGGVRVNVRYLGFAGVQVTAAGLVWWLLGWSWFKKLGPLWVLLAFAWPVPAFDERVSFRLRIWSADFAADLLQLLGIDLVQRGTGLLSAADPAAGLAAGERFQVGVAGPCSGMKSLLMLLMMAVVYGYLFHRLLWHRLALFAVAFPLALAGNVVRVSLLVLGTIWFGSEFAIGESEAKPSAYHIGAGLVVFAIVLCGLVALSAVLRREFAPWRRDKAVVVRRSADPSDSPSKPEPGGPS